MFIEDKKLAAYEYLTDGLGVPTKTVDMICNIFGYTLENLERILDHEIGEKFFDEILDWEE